MYGNITLMCFFVSESNIHIYVSMTERYPKIFLCTITFGEDITVVSQMNTILIALKSNSFSN